VELRGPLGAGDAGVRGRHRSCNNCLVYARRGGGAVLDLVDAVDPHAPADGTRPRLFPFRRSRTVTHARETPHCGHALGRTHSFGTARPGPARPTISIPQSTMHDVCTPLPGIVTAFVP